MADVVGTGDPDRAPRGGLVVGLVAALVAGGLAVSALRDEPRREATPPASPPASPTPPYGASPTTEPPASATPEPPPFVAPETRALRGRAVVTFQGTVGVVDLATGAHRPVRMPGPARNALRVGDAVVLYGGTGIGDFPPPAEPVYVVDGRLRARRLTTAGAVVPDAGGTGVWATTWTRDALVTRHVALTGATGPAWEGSGTQVVRAAVRGGRLVTVDLTTAGIDVWEAVGGRHVHREPHLTFLAGTGNRVVWGDDATCVKPCLLMWRDFPTDFVDGPDGCECGVIGTPLATWPHAATMSPDGRWIALQSAGDGTRLTVCRFGGDCVQPRNAVLHDGSAFQPSWTDDGTLLLATPPSVGRIAAWRPGWDDVRTIPGTHAVEGLAALGS